MCGIPSANAGISSTGPQTSARDVLELLRSALPDDPLPVLNQFSLIALSAVYSFLLGVMDDTITVLFVLGYDLGMDNQEAYQAFMDMIAEMLRALKS